MKVGSGVMGEIVMCLFITLKSVEMWDWIAGIYLYHLCT